MYSKIDLFCDDARFACNINSDLVYTFSALVATLDSLKVAASLTVGQVVRVYLPWGNYDSLRFSILSIDWDILTLCEAETGRVVECPASYCNADTWMIPAYRGCVPSRESTISVL